MRVWRRGSASLSTVITTSCLQAASAQQTANVASAQRVTGIPPAITTPDRTQTCIGTLEFKDGAPSAETARNVYDTLDFMRGVDALVDFLTVHRSESKPRFGTIRIGKQN